MSTDPKFWLAISFLIFVLLIAKYIFPKIIALLDQKSQQIAYQIKEAAELKAAAEELLIKTENHHQETLLYCQKLLQQTNQEVEQILKDSRKLIEEELAKKTEVIKDRIEQEGKKALREMQENIISISVESIRKQALNLNDKEIADKIIKDAIINIANH